MRNYYADQIIPIPTHIPERRAELRIVWVFG